MEIGFKIERKAKQVHKTKPVLKELSIKKKRNAQNVIRGERLLEKESQLIANPPAIKVTLNQPAQTHPSLKASHLRVAQLRIPQKNQPAPIQNRPEPENLLKNHHLALRKALPRVYELLRRARIWRHQETEHSKLLL